MKMYGANGDNIGYVSPCSRVFGASEDIPVYHMVFTLVCSPEYDAHVASA